MRSRVKLELDLVFVVISIIASNAWLYYDPNENFTKELATGAVWEYNRQTGNSMKLEKVLQACTYPIENKGVEWNITMTVSDSHWSDTNNYQALVFDQAWTHKRRLHYFSLHNSPYCCCT
ncbi:hypothetical protein VNO78_13275 [Psophocarpus tetragonolobus]|uniref:Cystatin domain-containing protein n=1 Tax=Psophocarpus tetragonolobus TaxID=3891 RepID=A0AAN9SX97_PSOTE